MHNEGLETLYFLTDYFHYYNYYYYERMEEETRPTHTLRSEGETRTGLFGDLGVKVRIILKLTLKKMRNVDCSNLVTSRDL